MKDDIEYTITPQEVLDSEGIKYSTKGNWLSVKYCPFCHGGQTKQVYTFGIHKFDFNYNCLRTTCGAASNFWNLLIHFGYDPKQFVKRRSHSQKPDRARKSSYVYRRQS
jgi:twinkle protein